MSEASDKFAQLGDFTAKQANEFMTRVIQAYASTLAELAWEFREDGVLSEEQIDRTIEESFDAVRESLSAVLAPAMADLAMASIRQSYRAHVAAPRYQRA